MNTKPTRRPFGIRDKFGYMFGDFDNDFTFILSTSILMKFYTDVMGVSAGVVGTLMMLAHFIDAITDVTMRRICDASKPTAAGKFKPWLLRMCFPVALASFLMYAPGLAGDFVATWSNGVRVAYLCITYILWGSFCYTGINIPYGSVASAISADPGDRQSLSTFRTMGGMAAGMFIGIGLPMVAYDKITLASGAVQDVINGQKVGIAALLSSISTLVPALEFILLALVLWFWYPLHKKQVDANVATLKAKREGSRINCPAASVRTVFQKLHVRRIHLRVVYNFNAKWAFSKEAASVPTEVSNKWNFVNLSHSWNAIDGQDGGNDYYRGIAYYAKTLDKLDLPVADRYYLEIRGANSSADVYVNGKNLAHHDGGYSTWRLDITDALQRDNLFVIAVDNSANETVYPQVADFTFYGGLYRDVNIICVNESHFDLDYYGGPGIKVTPVVDGANANVDVEVYVTNGKMGQDLRYTLLDAQGNTVANCCGTETKASFIIENVHRWHGRKDPYLYTAHVELLQDNEVLDNVSAVFGCRSFRIDPNNGFILNDEEYPLRGVSRHQDRWGIGNALLPEHHEEDIELICEVGATTIRLAHYQHDQYFYDLCDRKGLVIWAEIPPKKGEKVMGGFEMTDSMMDMLGGFTVLRLSGMIRTMGINLTKEQLLDLNAKLNKIKKPRK